jgi:hypothetical protein
MKIERRSEHLLGAVLVLGAFVTLGCGGASGPSRGNTGGSDSEETGGSGGSTPTGGKAGGGGGGRAGSGGSGGSMSSGGSGGSDRGGSGGSTETGGSGGSSETGGSDGGAGAGGSKGDASVDAPKGGSGGKGGGGGNQGLDPTGWPISMLTCDSPGLVWKTANKTNYTSYPAPGSAECIQYNGCFWQGKFNTCGDTLVKTKAWVMSHIVAFFPLGQMGLHNLCLRSGGKTIEVTAYDTCGDSDCNGCCSANKKGADALIDVESYTNKRWGVGDGRIEWADLGYKGATCTDSP